MITKKLWNTLSYKTRVEIISIYLGTPSFPPYYRDFVSYNYEHDFSYNHSGETLKKILECCRLQSDGSIDVISTVKPTYGGITKSKEQEEKEIKRSAKQHLKTVYSNPCKWYIDFEYPDGDEWDLCHCWVTADSKSEAESEFWDDHSSRCRIIQIRKAA